MLIRPLLWATRQEVEDFCGRHGLAWRTDHTNADTGYSRNFIRHELLPLLRQKMNPQVDQALLRLASAADEVESLLQSQAAAVLAKAVLERGEGTLRLDRRVLADAHGAVQSAAIRSALELLGVPMREVRAQRLDELRQLVVGIGPAAISLPGGYEARRERERVVVICPVSHAHPQTTRVDMAPIPGSSVPDLSIALAVPGTTALPDGRQIEIELVDCDAEKLKEHCRNHPAGVELLDADAVVGGLICRPRKRGDGFRPLGSPGTQTISDFLTNLKLPRAGRDVTICLCDDVGIVYLAPLRIAHRVRVTPQTRQVLRIRVKPKKNDANRQA